MIIRNITLNNYRLYKGNNTISFSTNGERNIFLISGENGFGKTTFLHSLIWCLYGRLMIEVESEAKKDISSGGYNNFLKNNLNNEVSAHLAELPSNVKEQIKKKGYSSEIEHFKEFTQYSVSINFGEVIIPSLPCTSLQVTRYYDAIIEKEFVEILIDGVKNELTNEIGPEVFINDFILNKDIARFFFFDSEQIVSLAETNTIAEKRRLCSAYNEVLGVRKYEDLKKNIENIRMRFRKKSSDTESRDRLLSLIDKQSELEQLKETNHSKTTLLENELKQLKTQDEALQLQLMREGNNATTKEIKRLEELIVVTKEKDEEYKKKLRLFLEYAPLAITGKLLQETKTQLESDYKKREASNNQLSRNLIVSDITSDLLQMLDRTEIPMDILSVLQQKIRDIVAKYKKEVIEYDSHLIMPDSDYEEFMAVYTNITTTYKSEFERLAEDYKRNKQILERNSRRLSNIQGKEKDEIIKSIRNQKNEIEAAINNKEFVIRSLHEELGTITQELATTVRQISELSKKVSLDDSDARKDKVAEQLTGELSSFLVSLKQEKKYSLERRIKSILNNLMHKEDFIGKVEVVVDGEDLDINLYSVDNNIINKDSLSKGEQQLYATSILKALVDESGIQFPVFIDSPLQKFDKSHATKIITEFYPQISKQVVLFPLLYKELTLEEYEVMKPLVNATYLIKNEITHSHIDNIPIDTFLTKQL